MIDGYNRAITYARISLTDLCNLRCFYCMGEDGVEKKQHREMLTIEQMLIVINALSQLGITKIRLTGGEPLLKKGLETLLKGINDCGIKDIGITTNGSYLQENLSLLKKYNVNKINISIDSLDKDIYSKITRGGDIKRVTNAIKTASTMGFKLKLNCVLLKGLNDKEIHNFAKFGQQYNALPRFIELMPFDCQNSDIDRYYISPAEVINSYQDLIPLNESDSTNTKYYSFSDQSVVGFISPISDKFCDSCNRIRITADGKLLNCLHQNAEYDLRTHLSNNENLKAYIQASVLKKPECHNISDNNKQSREMNAIGG